MGLRYAGSTRASPHKFCAAKSGALMRSLA